MNAAELLKINHQEKWEIMDVLYELRDVKFKKKQAAVLQRLDITLIR